MNDPALLRLARLHGVQTTHRDGFRQDCHPDVGAMLAILAGLGVRLRNPDDARHEIRRALADRWDRLVEPVLVVWAGSRPRCTLRLPLAAMGGSVEACLTTEGGAADCWGVRLADLRPRRDAQVLGTGYRVLEMPIPGPLSLGYHRLDVRVASTSSSALVISAPRACPGPHPGWGIFMPLYAVRSERSGGMGTLRDLGRIREWVQGLGGGFVGTLPLLATFLDEPFAPSPYTPVSRCFWNELFVDLAGIPEWSPELGGTEPAKGRHVDYRKRMRSKRRALKAALARIAESRRAELAEYVAQRPELRKYAAFRGGVERSAPSAARFDWADPDCAYHAYAQWTADTQLGGIARRASERGPGLYLDLPLGTHPRGFDRHRHARIFAPGVAGGAPPDRFFSKGQNWGFAPINPSRARASGHEYFIACVRHHMRHAGMLRIDHVMGLHRMFWIPDGSEGDQGAYVCHPSRELYAIVCLEAARSGTAVVGEDLGTVPRFVRRRMGEHGLRRMYVTQFSVNVGRRTGPTAPCRETVASVNTHDTAMFAAFWDGRDIDDQAALGLLTPEHAREAFEKRRRLREALRDHFRRHGMLSGPDPSASAVLAACLDELAASDAECVMVTIEDLLGEVEPQNTPGTDRERPNWRRRARWGLERILADPAVNATLRALNRRRAAPESGNTSGQGAHVSD